MRSQQHAPTVKETREAVVSLKSKLYKSAGPDMVTNWMLVWGGEPVIDVLQALFERAWNENSLPEQWCEATISYLYKGSGRKTEISNYSPISLISVIGKTFTRAWLPRLVAKVAPQLVQEQGCGRKGQGSMEQLWAFLDMTEESLEGKDEPGYSIYEGLPDDGPLGGGGVSNGAPNPNWEAIKWEALLNQNRLHSERRIREVAGQAEEAISAEKSIHSLEMDEVLRRITP